MKNPILVIDIGQTFIKFVVINQRYKVIKHIVYKNKLLIRQKILNYNLIKLKKILINNIKKIIRFYKINKIIPITHGSASFYIDKNDQYFSGPHFLQSTTKKFDRLFHKKLTKIDLTHTPKYEKFHNLGKSFFYLIKKKKENKLKKILTFPSLINLILTDKIFLDRSYLACHSFVWNFKKKNYSKYFNDLKSFFPPIIKSGKKIGYLNKNFSSKKKISVYNGFHDTSGSYLAVGKEKKFKNSLIVSTGTYFIISKKVKFKSKIKKGFYYNYGADNKLYLCKRLSSGLIYEKYNPKMFYLYNKKYLMKASRYFDRAKNIKITRLKKINKKSQINDFLSLNYYTAINLVNEIIKFNNKKINSVIIDGIFIKNRIFTFFLSKILKKNFFLIDNVFLNSLGASSLLIKNKLKLKYEILNDTYSS